MIEVALSRRTGVLDGVGGRIKDPGLVVLCRGEVVVGLSSDV